MPIPRRLITVFLPIFPFLTLLAFPSAAHAVVPKGDAFLGYSRLGTDAFYVNVGGLNGWEGAFHLKVRRLIGVEGDVAQYGLGADSSVPRTTTFLAGPRVTIGALRVRVFLHALAGGEHSANNGGGISINQSAAAFAFGGGVDLPVAPFFAWRATVDYLDAPPVSPGTGTHARFSTGLVFRF